MGADDQPTDELDTQGSRASTALADGPLLAGGRLLGDRYRLERSLGHGGMSAVWLATDERLGREVAVKVLSDTLAHDREYLDRFHREAQVAAGLQHPNLVSIYDFDAGDRPYLVMEYIGGGDLAERAEAGEQPEPESLARELLAALRHIHAAGVLHRDIKPQNVLVDSGGHARLTDFGIAQPRDATSLTRTGRVIGTENYLAPEVKRGEPASERSDLFALGVLLGDLAGAGAGAGLHELIERLRDPDPERRPASASAALAVLERGGGAATAATQPYAAAPPAEPPPPGPLATQPFEPSSARAGRGSGRRKLGLFALAALAVALIVGLALGTVGGDDGGSAVDVRERGENANGGGGGGGGGAGASEAPATETTETSGEETTPEAPASSDGAGLNDQGFALNQQGRYDEAVPILEQAVAALEGSGDEQTLNYALYNLGVAYLNSGRPDEAIPVLERRMGFDDGQLAEVEATLNEAYEAAGVEPSGGASSEKPGKGPKEKTPPGLEDD